MCTFQEYIHIYVCTILSKPSFRRMRHSGRQQHLVHATLAMCVCTMAESRMCSDVALSTSLGADTLLQLNCENHLMSEGVAEMFVGSTVENVEWKLCSDLQPNFDNIFADQKCACPAGFTDSVYGNNGLGLLVGLKNIDIGRITCQQECPPAYQSIALSANINTCACWNRRGCTFEQRTFLRLIPEEKYIQQAVVLVPDNLFYDSTVVACRQPSCAQGVSPYDIMVCSTQNIEYTYCNECPAECLRPHRTCVVDTVTRFCTVQCHSNYLRMLDNERGEHDCVLRSVCPSHFYNNIIATTRGDFFQQNCTACPIGKDNANAYERGCLQCSAGKINYLPGTACDFCAPDSVVFPGDTVCTPCLLIHPDTTVRRGATNCSDVVCRPSNVSVTSTCLSAAQKNHLSKCRQPGFGINSEGKCELCGQNYISTNISENVALSTASVGDVVWYYMCKECASNFFTDDVGMTKCIPCPFSHVRKSAEIFCTVCPAGNNIIATVSSYTACPMLALKTRSYFRRQTAGLS